MTETDEAFANAYSAAVSLQNLVPGVPQPLLIGLVTATATTGALVVDLVSYQSFLFLLGSVFVPLFAVLLADWLAAGRHYSADDVFEAPAWRPGLVAAWIAGFAVYQWLNPTGPVWWTDAVVEARAAGLGPGGDGPQFRHRLCSRTGGRGRRGSPPSGHRLTRRGERRRLPSDGIDPPPARQRADLVGGVRGSRVGGAELPPDRVLAEMASLGLGATEAGPDGYLGADPQRSRLSSRGTDSGS